MTLRKIPAQTFIIIMTAAAFMFLSQCDAPRPNSNQESVQQTAPDDGPELAELMGQLQLYTHKFTLSVNAQNHDLASFYFHEITALVDVIKKETPGYEGYDIARFTNLFLDPALSEVDQSLDAKEWEELRDRTVEMISACNSCHNATSHGFVQVTVGWDNNPYNQTFSKQ